MTPSTPKPIRARGDAPTDELTEALTRRQRLILETINAAIATHGYPPTMREIGDAVGLTSSSSVAHQLQALERKGFLRRDPKRPRAMEVVMPGVDDTPSAAPEPELSPNSVTVPLVGRIAAGVPITAEEQIEDVFTLPQRLVGDGAGDQRTPLRVRGHTMRSTSPTTRSTGIMPPPGAPSRYHRQRWSLSDDHRGRTCGLRGPADRTRSRSVPCRPADRAPPGDAVDGDCAVLGAALHPLAAHGDDALDPEPVPVGRRGGGRPWLVEDDDSAALRGAAGGAVGQEHVTGLQRRSHRGRGDAEALGHEAPHTSSATPAATTSNWLAGGITGWGCRRPFALSRDMPEISSGCASP